MLCNQSSRFGSGILVLLVSMAPVFASQGQAEDVPSTADKTLELVSTELLSSIEELQRIYDESAELFYQEIDSIVSPWIDFDSFYRGVMGRKYYGLATSEQRDTFREVFRQSLIQTYGKGLLGVEETRFEIDPPPNVTEEARSVPVKQTLYSAAGRIEVVYSMGRTEGGVWKVKNVILEGINLGKTFRSQFARSAREHNENLDLVIANWASDV